MQTRPLSLTIIGWLLIVFSLFGLFGVVSMGSNAAAMKMLEQMHTSLLFQQVWGVLGAIINVAVAYGIFKGLPWSRVLYVVWGVVGLVVAAYTSPIKVAVVVGLIFLVAISAFLFTNSANDWFCARGMMLKRERS